MTKAGRDYLREGNRQGMLLRSKGDPRHARRQAAVWSAARRADAAVEGYQRRTSGPSTVDGRRLG